MDGRLKLIGLNDSIVHTFALKNESGCTAENLKVLNTGKIHLYCPDDTIQWSPIEDLEEQRCKLVKKDPMPCHFDVEEKILLFERCQAQKSGKIVQFSRQSKSIVLDGRKCGVSNATDVKNSPLCFASADSETHHGKIKSREIWWKNQFCK